MSGFSMNKNNNFLNGNNNNNNNYSKSKQFKDQYSSLDDNKYKTVSNFNKTGYSMKTENPF